MGRYTCQAVNMLGVDNRSVDVTVKCEYYILVTDFHYLVLTFNYYM